MIWWAGIPGEETHVSVSAVRRPPQTCGGGKALDRGVPVIFQHVVPFSREHESRSRRSGAKVEIGRNDFQGADLARRLLHGSDLESDRGRSVLTGTTS